METAVKGKIEGVPFYGVIDRWTREPDESVLITDYKTGKAPSKRFQGDKIFQLMVYAALAAQTLHNARVEHTELIFLKNPGQRLAIDVTDEHMGTMRETVTNVVAEMRTAAATGQFETRVGPLCDWCNYKPICPAHQPKA